MNNRRAKGLRDLARRKTVGLPDRAYITHKMEKAVLTPTGKGHLPRFRVELDPRCTRAVYQRYKRYYANTKRSPQTVTIPKELPA